MTRREAISCQGCAERTQLTRDRAFAFDHSERRLELNSILVDNIFKDASEAQPHELHTFVRIRRSVR